MISINDQNKLLQQYYAIKKMTQFSLKIKLYLSTLQDLLLHGNINSLLKQFQEQFKELVQSISKHEIQQKIRFLIQHLKYMVQHLTNLNWEENKIEKIHTIKTKCEYQKKKLKVGYWTEADFRFVLDEEKAFITSKNTEICICLKNYNVRISKKEDKCLIFELISSKSPQKNSKISVKFMNKVICKEIYSAISQCVFNSMTQKLFKSIFVVGSDQKYHIKENSFMLLNQQTIFKFMIEKQHYVNKYLGKSNEFKQIQSINKQIKVFKHDKKDNLYKMYRKFGIGFDIVKENLPFYNWKCKQIINHQIVEQYSQSISLVHFVYNYSKKYQCLTIADTSYRQNEINIVLKGVYNVLINNAIQFLWIKVNIISAFETQILVVGDLNKQNKMKCKQQGQMFLENILRLHDNKNVNIKTQQNEQYDDNKDDMEFYSFDQSQSDDQQIKYQTKNQDIQFLSFQQIQKKQKQAQKLQLNKPEIIQFEPPKRYLLEPQKISTQKKQFSKQHYLHDWERNKNGGLICTNTAILSQQKKIFKNILSQVKQKLLKGRGLMSLSLPVAINKRQSYVKTVCNLFTYAPFFLQQKFQNPKQMMLALLKLSISMDCLTISMQKPFNPIMGETYQGYIDNCPIYAQQISHHPGITAIYMIGRGYKISGLFEPKLHLGFNCLKGENLRQIKVKFDDEQMYYVFRNGVMTIKGLLFGERQFNFVGKRYIFDKRNGLLGQIVYGNESKLFKKKQQDYICGKIYKIKKEHINSFQFDIHKNNTPKENQIEDLLTTFQGHLYQSVKFHHYTINFKQLLPFSLKLEEHPIPSDCYYRKDIQKLIQGDIVSAQKQKQSIEQLQRSDKKLRESKHKSKRKIK